MLPKLKQHFAEFSIAGSNEIFSAKVYAIEPEVEATRTLQVQAALQIIKNGIFYQVLSDVELPLDIIKMPL
jgi:membrane fusion protein (multidrug efflux system)